MGLPALIKEQVENTLLRYCEVRIPAHVRDRVRLSFKFRGNSVTLFEQRPAFHKPQNGWTSTWPSFVTIRKPRGGRCSGATGIPAGTSTIDWIPKRISMVFFAKLRMIQPEYSGDSPVPPTE